MTAPEGPFWAYPTSSAKKAHYFPGIDRPSGCRRYHSAVVALMDVLGRRPAEVVRCILCEQAEDARVRAAASAGSG